MAGFEQAFGGIPVESHSGSTVLWESGSGDTLAQGGYLTLKEPVSNFEKLVVTLAGDGTGTECSRQEVILDDLKNRTPRLTLFATNTFNVTLTIAYLTETQISITSFNQVGWTKSGIYKVEGYRRTMSQNPMGEDLATIIAQAIANGVSSKVVLYEGDAIQNDNLVPLSMPWGDFDFLLVQSDFGVTTIGDRLDMSPTLIPCDWFTKSVNLTIPVGERDNGSSRVWCGIRRSTSTAMGLMVNTEKSGDWVSPGIYKVTGIKNTPLTAQELLLPTAVPWAEVPASDYLLPFAKVQDTSGALSTLYHRFTDEYTYQVFGIIRLKDTTNSLNTPAARNLYKVPTEVVERGLPQGYTGMVTDYSTGCYTIYNPGEDHLIGVTGKFLGGASDKNTWFMINHTIPLSPKTT